MHRLGEARGGSARRPAAAVAFRRRNDIPERQEAERETRPPDEPAPANHGKARQRGVTRPRLEKDDGRVALKRRITVGPTTIQRIVGDKYDVAHGTLGATTRGANRNEDSDQREGRRRKRKERSEEEEQHRRTPPPPPRGGEGEPPPPTGEPPASRE